METPALKKSISEVDDSEQVSKPPPDCGYNDELDWHRGLPPTDDYAEEYIEIPPRNQWNGQPGFDAAEKIRKEKGLIYPGPE